MHKKAQINYYERLLAKHGANHLALDWNSPDSQKLRFDILKEIFLFSKKTVNLTLLDVGCGLGDLYDYLKKTEALTQNRISYAGYDLSPKLIEAAQKRFPEANFAVKDIAEDQSIAKFDFLFCCGVFNIRTLPKDEHLDFVKTMLRRMFDLAKSGVAVNFLSAGAWPDGNLEKHNLGRYFLFQPEEIISFCQLLTGQYILRHDYHPGDFTLYLLR